MKQCKICKEFKELSRFENHTTNDGKRSQCASCRYQARIERDPDYELKLRNRKLGYQYGINLKIYDDMLKRQDNKCAICLSVFDQTPCIDHDHSCCSGRNSCGNCVRGLLCRSCNNMLGQAKDSPQILERAVRYLSDYQEA